MIGAQVAPGDNGLLYLDEWIAPGDALNRGKRTRAIVAGADERRIRQRRNFSFHGIKGAVEEILHSTRHVAKVLRGAEQQAVGPEQVVRSGIPTQQPPDLDAGYIGVAGALVNGIGHALGAVGLGVVNDQQVFHAVQYTGAMKLSDIHAARDRIAGQVACTACTRSRTLSAITGANVFLKFENHQFTASFKERGALNCLLLLTPHERQRGVIAMSAGNHAQALAYHGSRLGVPACIVMPRSTPNVKVQQTRVFGAEVHLEGSTFEETLAFTEALAAERRLTLVHPFDDERVIAGQGTIGLEILEQVPDADAIVLPVGGGGLIGGTAMAVKSVAPAVAVAGVQVERFAAAYDRFHGRRGEAGPSGTVAEGIAVKSPGEQTWRLIEAYVDTLFLVNETEVEQAIFTLLEIEKTVVEGAGAAALAALAANTDRFRGSNVVLVLSGGNVDMMVLSSVLQRGLVRSHRLARLDVEIPDVPGALAQLTDVLGRLDSNIVDIVHQRAFGGSSVRATIVELVLQMRGEEQVEQVLTALRQRGYEATFRSGAKPRD